MHVLVKGEGAPHPAHRCAANDHPVKDMHSEYQPTKSSGKPKQIEVTVTAHHNRVPSIASWKKLETDYCHHQRDDEHDGGNLHEKPSLLVKSSARAWVNRRRPNAAL